MNINAMARAGFEVATADLLEDLHGGGPGRGVEKILLMYDIKDLEEMAKIAV